jgi:hypothetical protein
MDVTNFQRYILNHGPALPSPLRVSRVPPGSTASMPASFSQLHSAQSSGAVLADCPDQEMCRLRPSESELRLPRHRPGFVTPGRVLVPLMSIVCILIVSNPPAGCPRCVAMTRRSYISGRSARSASSKAGPLKSVVGAPAAGSAQ